MPAGLDRLTGHRAAAATAANSAATVQQRGNRNNDGSRASFAYRSRHAPHQSLKQKNGPANKVEGATVSARGNGGNNASNLTNPSSHRPRTASVAGSVGNARAGGRTRGGTSGRPRPRSASSWFASSSSEPSRSRGVRGRANTVETEMGAGGSDARGRPRRDGDDGLPDGWAQAVDEQSGHAYYYSEKR